MICIDLLKDCLVSNVDVEHFGRGARLFPKGVVDWFSAKAARRGSHNKLSERTVCFLRA